MSAPIAVDPAELAGHLWWYPARVVSIHDGDTCALEIDCGFHVYHTLNIRVRGVNAPELYGATKPQGEAARQFVVDWLARAAQNAAAVDTALWPLVVKSLRIVHRSGEGDEAITFDRFVADLYDRTTGASLGADLVASGNAVLFMEGMT